MHRNRHSTSIMAILHANICEHGLIHRNETNSLCVCVYVSSKRRREERFELCSCEGKNIESGEEVSKVIIILNSRLSLLSVRVNFNRAKLSGFLNGF